MIALNVCSRNRCRRRDQHALSTTEKPKLRENSLAAQQRGILGAPSFVVGKEFFWGNDRLQDALAWALRPR